MTVNTHRWFLANIAINVVSAAGNLFLVSLHLRSHLWLSAGYQGFPVLLSVGLCYYWSTREVIVELDVLEREARIRMVESQTSINESMEQAIRKNGIEVTVDAARPISSKLH